MVRGSLAGIVVLVSLASLSADEPTSVEQLKAETDGLRMSLEAEQRKSTTLQKLNESQRAINQELQQQLDELRKSLEATARDRDAKLKQFQDSIDELKAQARKAVADNEAALKLQQSREEQIPMLKKEIDSLREQLITEQLKSKTLSDRNESTAKVLEQTTKQLSELTRQNEEKAKLAPAKTVALEKTKTAPVLHGKVTELDATKQLIVIDLGSVAGVKPGDVLEVYRVAADPKESLYLGQATVIRTTETSAVCRHAAAGEGRQPRLNDAVATSLANPK